MTVRVGVIGIGFGQRAHAPAFSAVAGCEVVALCASSEERARKVAERLGIGKAYGDWRAMIEDPEIDAVSIATPPTLQPAIALAAMDQGKAVFCEKPLAGSQAEAARMAASARRAGVANMCDFELPELATWRSARSILDEGKIGPLRHIAVNWNVETYANKMGLDSWKTDTIAGGGVLNAFVSHTFHYIEWFAGPIQELSARLFRAPGDAGLSPATGERKGRDTVAVLCLKLQSGAPVSISVSSNAFLGNGHHIAFYGDDGALVLDNPTTDYAGGFRLFCGTRQSNCLEEVEVEELSCRQVDVAGEDGRIPLVGRLAARFVDWIRNGVPAHPDFEDGLRVQNLLEAARRSDASGCWTREPF